MLTIYGYHNSSAGAKETCCTSAKDILPVSLNLFLHRSWNNLAASAVREESALNLDKAVEIVNLVNQTLLYLSSGQTCSAFSVWSICMSTCIHLIAAMNGICQAQPQRLSSMSCNTPQTFKGIKQVGIIATFPWTKLGKLRMAEFLVHRGRVTALFNCKVEAKHTSADSTYRTLFKWTA